MADEKNKAGKKRLYCPYCDEEVFNADAPFCEPCKVRLFWCPECKLPMPRENTKCPHCGAEIKVKK